MFDVPEGGENAKLVGKTVLVDVEGDIGGMEEHWKLRVIVGSESVASSNGREGEYPDSVVLLEISCYACRT